MSDHRKSLSTTTSSTSSVIISVLLDSIDNGKPKETAAEAAGRFHMTPTKWIVLFASIATAVFGAAQILSQKWQNMQLVPTCDTCESTYFEAPFTQAFQMYAGESLCLIAFLISYCVHRYGRDFGPFSLPHSTEKPECNPLWWIIPAMCDLGATGAMNYANTITLASTVTVLRNLLVLIAAILRLVWIRAPLHVFEYFGVALVTVGMILTALYGIMHPEEDTNWDASLSWLGIVLALVGTSVQALQVTIEEKLFRRYRMHPFAAMGLEGVYGMIMTACLLAILQATGGEDVRGAIYQTGHNSIIMASTFMYMIFAFLFNGCGLTVTSLATALLRTILFASRSIIVWIFELSVGWNIFDVLDLCGQIVCIIGVAVFAGIVVTPWWPKFNAWFNKPVYIPGLTTYAEIDDEELVTHNSIVARIESNVVTNEKSIVSN